MRRQAASDLPPSDPARRRRPRRLLRLGPVRPGDVCAQLARDDQEREAIARNARDFFDRYLDKRQLAARYLGAITDARAGRARNH